jgi:Fur family ferric uptake transcriptional regulator
MSNTSTRKLGKNCLLVLQALKQNDTLSSVQDIYAWLKTFSKDAPALTTVYRVLYRLIDMRMVQSVELGAGEKFYELIEPRKHHHHLICTNCYSSIRIDRCSVEALTDNIASHHGFHVHSHVLELFGICRSCTRAEN